MLLLMQLQIASKRVSCSGSRSAFLIRYAFTKHERQRLLHTLFYLMDITNPLHFTLQHEDTHTKQEPSLELFYIFLRAKTKTFFFVISLTFNMKYGSYTFGAVDVHTSNLRTCFHATFLN